MTASAAGGDLRTITDHVDGTDSASLTYDGLHRLKTASGLWGSWTYTYDTLNNLRSRSGPSSLTYTINATSNRLTAISGGQTRTYSYNAKGEITGDGTKSFTLNSLGQIKSITGVATYAYDGNGRRIKTTLANGTVEYTLYTRSGQLAYREIGTQKTDFLNLNGQTLASLIKNANGTTAVGYLHPDLLGSPRLATNATGGIIWREHYDPYGRKLNGNTGRIGYTGHVLDAESGYTYMQARFYDAAVGRFLSTDPAHFTDDNPFSFNRYAYANNNPYKYTDPNGQQGASIFELFAQAMSGGDGGSSPLSRGAASAALAAAVPQAAMLGNAVGAAQPVAEQVATPQNLSAVGNVTAMVGAVTGNPPLTALGSAMSGIGSVAQHLQGPSPATQVGLVLEVAGAAASGSGPAATIAANAAQLGWNIGGEAAMSAATEALAGKTSEMMNEIKQNTFEQWR